MHLYSMAFPEFFNLWIRIVILNFNLHCILYFTVFYDCFVQHFGQCKLNLNVLYK